jgi:hypothetical protein
MKSWTPRGSQPRPERPSDCNKLSPQRSQRLTFFVISVRSVVNSSRAEKNSTIFSWRSADRHCRRRSRDAWRDRAPSTVNRRASNPSRVRKGILHLLGGTFRRFSSSGWGGSRTREGGLGERWQSAGRAPAEAEDLARVRAPSSGGAKDLSPGREPWVRRPLTPFRTRLPPRAGDECGQKAVASKPTAHAVG